MKRSEQLLAEF